MVNGVADAVDNNLPHDGSIELAVVQFGDGLLELHDGVNYMARTEVLPTVVTAANYMTISAAIRAMSQDGGSTSMADGVWVAWDDMKDSPNFTPQLFQVINLATDGMPNEPLSDPRYTGDPALDVPVARDDAVAEGLDELDSEALVPADIDYLKDNVVWPQPGKEAPPFSPGWVQQVLDAVAFAKAIPHKFEIIVGVVGGESLPLDIGIVMTPWIALAVLAIAVVITVVAYKKLG